MVYLTKESSKGCGNIIVITDHFTKYALAIATKKKKKKKKNNKQTAKTTAEALYENFIITYEIPARIQGQGACFESEIIKELCKLTGMTKSRSTLYHAMGKSIPERYNRTLLNMLGTLEPEKKSILKKYLPCLTYAYNSHVMGQQKSHSANMFGRKPRLPTDSLFDTAVQESSSQTTKEYIKDLKQIMTTAQDIVNEETERAIIKMVMKEEPRQLK